MNRVRPDYSSRLNAGDDGEFLLDPTYDFIRVFGWIGHAVINVITTDGVARMHVDEATARRVHETSGIPLIELDWICESEYEMYLDIRGGQLTDDLLDD